MEFQAKTLIQKMIDALPEDFGGSFLIWLSDEDAYISTQVAKPQKLEIAGPTVLGAVAAGLIKEFGVPKETILDEFQRAMEVYSR